MIKIYKTMNRKYPEVVGYWVYSIQIKSNGKFYIGVSKSKKCSKRWNKANYKSCSLSPYLNEWQDMKKTVLVDNLTKEQAYKYEDNIIRALQMNNLCLNKQQSGLFRTNDKNAYKRELRKNNTEFREREKQYRENNKEKVLERQRQRRLKKKLEQQQLN